MGSLVPIFKVMSSTEKLCLQWNDFKENIISSCSDLREDKELTDVTLACEDGQQIEAHKVILASSSPFFMELLKKNKHPHPLVYMRGVSSESLIAIIDFLYHGEANILNDNIDPFLALAEELRLKGLSRGAADGQENQQTERVFMKEEGSKQFQKTPSPNPDNSIDTAVALPNDKISVGLGDLDDQIRSMITKSEISAGQGKGFMATCNMCGKQGPYFSMPNHVEANHITGVSHACDICGKTSRSRHALRLHISYKHKSGQQNSLQD